MNTRPVRLLRDSPQRHARHRPSVWLALIALIAPIAGCPRPPVDDDAATAPRDTAPPSIDAVSLVDVPSALPDAEAADTALDAPAADATLDAAAVDAGPIRRSAADVRVEACTSLGTGTEPCFYSFAWNPAACPGGRCARLIIDFSGGQETCSAVDPPSFWFQHWIDAGYVAVCARDFETSTGSAMFPRHRESTRFDTLVRAIKSDPDVSRAWTGEDLLLSGTSHGASGPMIGLSHQSPELQALWSGSRFTGACFHDGTYDAPALIQRYYDERCGSGSIVPYDRLYERYCPWPAGARLAFPATWPAPSTCSNADTAADRIVDAPVSGFGIHDFALVECGSGLSEFCGRILTPLMPADALPAAPIQALCDHLAATPGTTCDYISHPMVGHSTCGFDDETLDDCNAWFRGRLMAHGITP